MVVGGGGPPRRAGGRPAAASSFLPAIFRLSRLFHRRAAALATLSFPPFPIVAKFSPLLTIGIAKPPLPLPLQYLYLIKLSSTATTTTTMYHSNIHHHRDENHDMDMGHGESPASTPLYGRTWLNNYCLLTVGIQCTIISPQRTPREHYHNSSTIMHLENGECRDNT